MLSHARLCLLCVANDHVNAFDDRVPLPSVPVYLQNTRHQYNPTEILFPNGRCGGRVVCCIRSKIDRPRRGYAYSHLPTNGQCIDSVVFTDSPVVVVCWWVM